MGLIIVSIIFNVIPMVLLPVLYTSIPDTIPAFVDVWGNTVVSMEKSCVSIFRLPVMGILLSIMCIIMHKIQFEGENNTVNKMIWPVIAVIGSLKMGITSLEILFYENMETIKYFRMSIFVLVIIGIIILIYGLIKMNKHKTAFMEYKNCIHNNKIVITGILFAYVIIALMPVYMKPASPP